MQDDPDYRKHRLLCVPQEATGGLEMPGVEHSEEVDSKTGRLQGASPQRPLEHLEDFYYEGEMIVFTANYHLRRGYCCESGCRHCPYPLETSS